VLVSCVCVCLVSGFVVRVHLVMDPRGRPSGVAFVEVATDEDVRLAGDTAHVW